MRNEVWFDFYVGTNIEYKGDQPPPWSNDIGDPNLLYQFSAGSYLFFNVVNHIQTDENFTFDIYVQYWVPERYSDSTVKLFKIVVNGIMYNDDETEEVIIQIQHDCEYFASVDGFGECENWSTFFINYLGFNEFPMFGGEFSIPDVFNFSGGEIPQSNILNYRLPYGEGVNFQMLNLTFDYYGNPLMEYFNMKIFINIKNEKPVLPTIMPTEYIFDKNSTQPNYKDLVFTLNQGTYQFINITIDGTEMEEGRDYIRSDNVFTFSKERLNEILTYVGIYSFIFHHNNGITATSVITVIFTRNAYYPLAYRDGDKYISFDDPPYKTTAIRKTNSIVKFGEMLLAYQNMPDKGNMRYRQFNSSQGLYQVPIIESEV